MEQYNNQRDLLAIVALMDTHERLLEQKKKFQELKDSQTRETLLAASDFVLDQVLAFLDAGLEKAKKDKEIHSRAEDAGIIIQAGVGNGILLPGQKRN